MPSDLAPISTTTWVGVIFRTVPLSTLSSVTASSLSVVKLSRAAAKSSVEDCASSALLAVGVGKVAPSLDSGAPSATPVDTAKSRLWAVLSLDKFVASQRNFSHVGCGQDAGT